MEVAGSGADGAGRGVGAISAIRRAHGYSSTGRHLRGIVVAVILCAIARPGSAGRRQAAAGKKTFDWDLRLLPFMSLFPVRCNKVLSGGGLFRISIKNIKFLIFTLSDERPHAGKIRIPPKESFQAKFFPGMGLALFTRKRLKAVASVSKWPAWRELVERPVRQQ